MSKDGSKNQTGLLRLTMPEKEAARTGHFNRLWSSNSATKLMVYIYIYFFLKSPELDTLFNLIKKFFNKLIYFFYYMINLW